MSEKTRRIGVLTGGGDCPGLNAVIRAVVKSANNIGWTVIGIKKGFEGLMHPRNAEILDAHDISGILNIGGTILGTTNRGDPFKYSVTKNGKTTCTDRSDDAAKGFKKLKLDALVCIGGDGTLSIAKQLADKGIPLVGVPKTIDNDLSATVITFGFDTAVSTATDALDKLHSTAESHQRVMVVEVMGRYAGWIALNSGIAGGADIILIPEIPFDMNKVCEKVIARYKMKRNFCIVVVAEGAKPKGGGMFTKDSDTKGRVEVLLGGIAEWVAKEIHSKTGKETRSLVLGHLQRGGNPTTFDRLLATRFGAAAIRTLKENKFGEMVCLRPPHVISVPLIEAIGKMKSVPLDSDEIVTGRNMGISFGD
ncbi:MAG: 6-phosphofructokinase [Candidatus Firestonebacteria bacterium RIFOXYC2_FULL_39_67]|nr:MAG: 6-phosphofructokinase [Candidatus Firestonebacteria bacterium RIFOXYD2_FULL_39_29]OGF53037.1 MAG: 6-phosphofructokinase [Candidatus Firestonebacteria bacterium RifOxyC12_full_39_7]OGF54507.1 MAG: 6-phosphofructokinase [Candidatus Firestonebacteria bacterium RIFOXYC2_FULL_39_67]